MAAPGSSRPTPLLEQELPWHRAAHTVAQGRKGNLAAVQKYPNTLPQGFGVEGEEETTATVNWHCCPESCECHIPEGAQGQVGWGPGQHELVRAASPWQRLGLGGLKVPFQFKPFYGSTNWLRNFME